MASLRGREWALFLGGPLSTKILEPCGRAPQPCRQGYARNAANENSRSYQSANGPERAGGPFRQNQNREQKGNAGIKQKPSPPLHWAGSKRKRRREDCFKEEHEAENAGQHGHARHREQQQESAANPVNNAKKKTQEEVPGGMRAQCLDQLNYSDNEEDAAQQYGGHGGRSKWVSHEQHTQSRGQNTHEDSPSRTTLHFRGHILSQVMGRCGHKDRLPSLAGHADRETASWNSFIVWA